MHAIFGLRCVSEQPFAEHVKRPRVPLDEGFEGLPIAVCSTNGQLFTARL